MDKTEPSQTVSQKDIINYDNLLQGKKIVIQDSLAFLKCCESLAFLIRDVAHITPHNFSQCVSTLRIFVEASYSGRMVNKPENLNENKPTAAITSSKSAMKRTPFNKSGPSSAIRKVRSAPHNVRSATVNSVSTPTSSDYDGDESDTEDLSSEFHHVALQLLGMVSHKKSLKTNFGHKHFRQKFHQKSDIFS